MDLNKMTFEKKDGIGWARFNRPEKLNALNTEVFADIGTIVAACEDDDEVRVLVLTGSDKVFAAGADIDGMAQSTIKDAFAMTDRGIPVTERLADFPKPTIAAISGYALGGGLEAALCCDFRIADHTAMVGLPEINLGIIPGGGGTQRLPRLINPSKALELIMTGDIIEAKTALNLGILNQVVAQGKLEAAVTELAKKLMAKPAMGIRAAKTAVRKGLNVSLKDGIALEQDLFCMLFGTQDQKEGMTAFLEKRKPVFKHT
ncbi:MAG TPA: enoyl-CoA hydratase [Desulfobacteraceae bacterium]|nr:enoyl-CoA hydratase [Desulfobacteraceae bacterium]